MSLENGKISRREVLKWAGLGAAGAVAAGCGGTAPAPTAAPTSAAPAATKPAAAPTTAAAAPTAAAATTPAVKTGAKTTVTMWETTNIAQVSDMMKLQVQDCMKKNPDIDFKLTEQANIDTLIVTAFGSGTAPHLNVGDGYFVSRRFIDAGYIRPLDDYYSLRKWNFYDFYHQLTTIDGKFHTIPYGSQTNGIYYNTAVLNKLGLQVPKTWKELQDACDVAKKAGIVPYCSDNTTATNVRRIYMTYKYALMTPKEINGVLFGDTPFDNPAFLEAAKMVRDMFQRGWADAKVGNALNSDQAMPRFAAGQHLFWLCGTFNRKRHLEALKEFPDFKWGYFHMPPVANIPQAVIAGNDHSIYVSAANKKEDEDAILRVLEYWMGKDNYFNKTSLEMAGRTPCMPFDQTGMNIPEDVKFYVDAIHNTPRAQVGFQLVKCWPTEMQTYDKQAGMGLASGDVTPEQFVKELATLWEKAKKVKGGRWELPGWEKMI